MKNEGKSFYEITRELNKAGFKTRRGNNFYITQVINLYERHLQIQ